MPKVRASEKQSSDQNPGSLVPESTLSTKILSTCSVPSLALGCIDAKENLTKGLPVCIDHSNRGATAPLAQNGAFLAQPGGSEKLACFSLALHSPTVWLPFLSCLLTGTPSLPTGHPTPSYIQPSPSLSSHREELRAPSSGHPSAQEPQGRRPHSPVHLPPQMNLSHFIYP